MKPQSFSDPYIVYRRLNTEVQRNEPGLTHYVFYFTSGVPSATGSFYVEVSVHLQTLQTAYFYPRHLLNGGTSLQPHSAGECTVEWLWLEFGAYAGRTVKEHHIKIC